MQKLPYPRSNYYFNPRPPRGGRPFSVAFSIFFMLISIHALREEGDPTWWFPL